MNQEFQWVVDQHEIKSGSRLEIGIGGHWILGTIIESHGSFYWVSWTDGVTVLVSIGIKARLPIVN